MLIDVTTVENTRVLRVGDMERVQLHGRLYMAQGKKVIAPPVEGRGFSKLDKLPLQYLYWNTVGEAPPEDYGQLVSKCLTVIRELPICEDHLPTLHEQADGLGTQPNPNPVTATAQPVVKPPGKRTTTGVIWDICDECLEDICDGAFPQDTKELRAEVVNRCTAEGFNPSTISVQYSAWKRAKMGQ